MPEYVKISGIKQVELLLSDIKNGSRIALVRAINRSLVSGRKKASDEIRKEFNIKASVAKDTFTLAKASKSNITASLKSTGRPLSFMTSEGLRFSGSKRKKGYGFTIKKGRGRKVFKGAFVMKLKTGAQRVFIRRGSAAGKSRSSGLKTLFTSRVPDILINPEPMKNVLDYAADAIQKNLEHETDYLLKNG